MRSRSSDRPAAHTPTQAIADTITHIPAPTARAFPTPVACLSPVFRFVTNVVSREDSPIHIRTAPVKAAIASKINMQALLA